MERRATMLVFCALAGCSLAYSGQEHQRVDGGADAGSIDAGRVDAGPRPDGGAGDAGAREDGGGDGDGGPPPRCTSQAECDDGNECTADDCVDGSCSQVDDDSRRCASGAGQCASGACVCDGCFDGVGCRPGTGASACGAAGGDCVSCDDALSCTADLCAGDPPGCEHLVVTDACAIDGACFDTGVRDESNDCLVCTPSNSQTSWTELAFDASCTRDGQAGKCQGDAGARACCAAYASACETAADCCDSVPCISGSCRYP